MINYALQFVSSRMSFMIVYDKDGFFCTIFFFHHSTHCFFCPAYPFPGLIMIDDKKNGTLPRRVW